MFRGRRAPPAVLDEICVDDRVKTDARIKTTRDFSRKGQDLLERVYAVVHMI